jgi:hypothetical protein
MKIIVIVFGAIVLAALTLVAGAFFALRATLAPMPGEWSVPLALGPITVRAGVPSVVRLATSAWGGPLLHGRSISTRRGLLQLSWAGEGWLQVRCAPCVVQPPGLGEEPLRLAEVQLTVRRIGEQLWGDFAAGQVRGAWQGRMAGGRLQLRLLVPWTPLANGYALFAADIPEVGRARIEGMFSLEAQLSLPDGTLAVRPHIDGIAAPGLGTEALAGARSQCTRRASRLTAESWLSRAVIAAEDQRFWEHPGYDLAEVAAALAQNQQEQRLTRGASTLSQQVARLLITGGERSPVRKLRELLYAVELERTLGKPRILRLYLDNAPWGAGLCGAEAAARRYFGVRAHELTVSQAGWLAAMLHNPQAEAQRWASAGTINVARAQWVVLGMRGMPKSRKLDIAQAIADGDWKPEWASPEVR